MLKMMKELLTVSLTILANIGPVAETISPVKGGSQIAQIVQFLCEDIFRVRMNVEDWKKENIT